MIQPLHLLLLTVAALILNFLTTPLQTNQDWRPVSGGTGFNMSGMAFIEQKNGRTSFLVVQDSKKPGEDRTGIVTVTRSGMPQYSRVAWPSSDDLPEDLEAISSIPGHPDTFLALDSDGKVYHLALDGDRKAVSLLRTLQLPDCDESHNYEGLAVQQFNDKLLAVWAHRGENQEPAVLGWSTYEPLTGTWGTVTTGTLTAAWPVSSEVRHVTDLKVDASGTLYTVAASDRGNFGPFQSAVYISGVFSASEDGFTFRRNPEPVRIQLVRNNKAEALELLPSAAGGLVLGSDDESIGGSICLSW